MNIRICMLSFLLFFPFQSQSFALLTYPNKLAYSLLKKIEYTFQTLEKRTICTINRITLYYVLRIIKKHPYLTTLIIFMLLQRDMREFLSGWVTYWIDEHPFITIIILYLLMRHLCVTMEIILIHS